MHLCKIFYKKIYYYDSILNFTMKTKTRNRLKNFGTNCLLWAIGAGYFATFAVPLWMNSKFRDIGEGYRVREIRNQRLYCQIVPRLDRPDPIFGMQYYVIGNRYYLDRNKDGTLDETWINIPISPAMGGPGWKPITTTTTEEDRKKFQRANYLYSLNNNTANGSL